MHQQKKHTKDTSFLIHGYPEWWEDMKKARENRSSNRGGRAAVAVGERATYTENPSAGSVATPTTINGEDRNRGGDEKKVVASVSVARAWSEGNRLEIGVACSQTTATEVPTGGQEDGARVLEVLGVTARVWEERGDLCSLNTPTSPTFEIDPPNSQISKNIPQLQNTFQSQPHNSQITQKPPQTSPETKLPPILPKLYKLDHNCQKISKFSLRSM